MPTILLQRARHMTSASQRPVWRYGASPSGWHRFLYASSRSATIEIRQLTEPYKEITTLTQAHAHPDSVVLLSGDWGGHVFLVCRVRYVQCAEPALQQLLHDLNLIAWPMDRQGSTQLMYVHGDEWHGWVPDASRIQFNGRLWVDQLFVELALVPDIAAVLRGERERLRHAYDVVHVVVRLDSKPHVDPTVSVRVLQIVPSFQEAKSEVERLTRSSGTEDFQYFQTRAWLPKPWPRLWPWQSD